MVYHLRNARMEDLPRILEIYEYARRFMAENGNPDQWGAHHPPVNLLQNDIARQLLYVLENDSVVHGVFYFYIGSDPTYLTIENGNWRSLSVYGTIHRIAGDGSGGILKAAVEFAKTQIDHIRIDTHQDNMVMQSALDKLMFSRRGIIRLENGDPRIAYDLLV